MSTSATLPAPGKSTVPARGEPTPCAAATGAGRRWTTWLGLWNGDLAAAADLIDPGFIVHTTLLDGSPATSIRGARGLTDWITASTAAFTDLHFDTVVGPLTDATHLCGHWRATGTYTGAIPAATAAAGISVTFHGTDVLRVDHDRIVEYWLTTDTIALFAQLGIAAS